MNAVRRLVVLVALAAAGVLLAAACGGGEQRIIGITELSGLRGRTIGVTSLVDTFTLEARYLLQEAEGLRASPAEGDVTLVEAPAQSLPSLLLDREIDAALMRERDAFLLLDDDRFRILSHVTEEVRELTDTAVISSVLITYPDVTEQKREALVEALRLFSESGIYFRTNQGDVIDTVAEAEETDPEFLTWWWDRHDLLLGDLSEDVQGQLLSFWNAAAAVGDIEVMPDLADVLFGEGDEAKVEESANGDRTTISIALLDHPSRRAALYAIEQGILTSDTVDLDITYLPQSALGEAAAAGLYDVIETSPLAVALGAERNLELIILSGALQDQDGTLLFVRN
ncbi:MAG: hypothetical protein IIB87_00700 [Chloroflexi bacterium]|nr:hypothetical protein [Chloroflexota bacterium]